MKKFNKKEDTDMRCPICNYIAGEIKDSKGTNYHCTNPDCTWTGTYELDELKKDDDKKDKKGWW